MYAHSIRNPHIIHYQIDEIRDTIRGPEKYQHYICGPNFTPSKATTDKDKVTCKNCLKELDRDDGRWNVNLNNAEIKLIYQLIDDRIQLGEGDGYTQTEKDAIKSSYFKFSGMYDRVRK